ncbi:MAG: hypothetical protein V4850_29295 [Myxococcota bacterium]
MTMLLALVLSSALPAAAAPPLLPAPWPADTPLVYTFTYGIGGFVLQGERPSASQQLPPLRYTWTCRAKPMKKSGRQEMTCDEPGLGTVWMLWGPGRELVEVDIDEDASALGDDRHRHRVTVLAGALELWPAAPVAGVGWEQGGRFGVLRVAPATSNSAYTLAHTVSRVEGDRVFITSTGSGTALVGSAGDTGSRVQLAVAGEAEFDTAAGVLVERSVRVNVTQFVGTYGTLGHEVTVTRVP